MSLQDLFLILKGSELSGNYAHAGDSPNKGGSSPGGGLSAIGLKPDSTKKERVLASGDKRFLEVSDKSNIAELSTGLDNLYKLPDKCGVKFNCEGIKKYTDTSYKQTNDYLRGKGQLSEQGKKNIGEIIKQVDEVIDKSPRLNGNLKVYRGVTKEVFDRLTKGDEFEDKGYGSTTIDKKFAKEWGDGSSFEIRVPRGAKGVYVDSISSYSGTEREFVLPRGSKFKVLSKSGNQAILELII